MAPRYHFGSIFLTVISKVPTRTSALLRAQIAQILSSRGCTAHSVPTFDGEQRSAAIPNGSGSSLTVGQRPPFHAREADWRNVCA